MRKILTSVLYFTVLFIVFAEFFHPIHILRNQDLPRHIKFGEIVLSTHTIPTTNLFSYTYPDFHYVNSDWLSGGIFYVISHFLSTSGLLLFSTTSILVAFGLVFVYSLKKSGIYATLPVSLLALLILSERTEIRPEIFSFLFLASFLVILYKSREHFTKWIFLLIPLEVIWVNTHIYFILGPLLIFLFLLEPIFIVLLDKNSNLKAKISKILTTNYNTPRALASSKWRLLATVFFLTCLATLFNPSGIAGAIFPFTVFHNYGYGVDENINVFLVQQSSPTLTIIFYELGSLFLIGMLLFNVRKTRLIDWLISLTFIVIAASAVRNLPLFVFATFIPFAFTLRSYTHTLFSPQKIHAFKISSKSIFFLSCIFILLVVEAYMIIPTKGIGYKLEDDNKPSMTFFIQNHLKGPIFNNFNAGSYVDYALYPQERVFVDARPEAYPATFFSSTYIPMLRDPKVFAKEDKKYHFNVIYFTHTDETQEGFFFLQQIVKNPSWKMVYVDTYAVIFVKDTPQNQSIIKKYGMTQSSVVITNFSEDKNNVDALYRIALAFRKFGWIQDEVAIYPYILRLQPNHCLSLRRLSFLFQNSTSLQAQNIRDRYSEYCQ